MSTLQLRSPYNKEDLAKLYPPELELRLVQVLLRHGERAPVSARFQNAGLSQYWPYCNAAKQMRSIAKTPNDLTGWTSLEWQRKLETFSKGDSPVIAAGLNGEADSVCELGELTDKGRDTTYQLGSHLRHLYVDQLKFMPELISDTDMIYLRATSVPRALESVQQTFWGMYPATTRTASFLPPTIITRAQTDETLYPNIFVCRRFKQLSEAFAKRSADRWNGTEDLKYVSSKIGKWMPENSKQVAVDSHPRLSGIMDTVNSTLAHGPDTRLPKEFYDEKLQKIVDTVCVEEWFSGFLTSKEYRSLGIGALAGDITQRMVVQTEVGVGNEGPGQLQEGKSGINFALSGCHDTSLGGYLAALGAFDGESWPPFTSHVAVEMFRKRSDQHSPVPADITTTKDQRSSSSMLGWLGSVIGLRSAPFQSNMATNGGTTQKEDAARRPWSEITDSEKKRLDGYYVRIRYNDRVMKMPGCAKAGRHLEGDESFCTLEAFKRITDSYTPKNWKAQCQQNLDGPIDGLTPGTESRAGNIEEGF